VVDIDLDVIVKNRSHDLMFVDDLYDRNNQVLLRCTPLKSRVQVFNSLFLNIFSATNLNPYQLDTVNDILKIFESGDLPNQLSYR
jgi:superfamily II DNA or RNA helicase